MSMDGERAFEKVVEIAQEQARSTAALAEIERGTSVKIDALMSVAAAQTAALASVSNSLAHLDSARAMWLQDLKAHISLETMKHSRSHRTLLWLLAALIAASNMLGPLLAKLATK